MSEIFSRTEALLGKQSMQKLNSARVAIFGLGGVGSAAFEALLRSGVGQIEVFDYDTVSPTNLNRQLLATEKTIGMKKCDAAVLRAKDISPATKIVPHDMFYLPENSAEVDFSQFDAVIDAVDTVTAKLEIIKNAKEKGVFIISSMGTGNKLDITKLRVDDIYSTTDCPLARIMRKELRKRGIDKLDVVWSDEKPDFALDTGDLKGERPAPASAIFVPAAAGLLLAKQTVDYIISKGE